MFKVWPDKDPNEILDYSVDWNPRLLDDDSIASSTWTISTTDGSLVIDSAVPAAAGITTVWLSGGTEGYSYVLTNRVITTDGRTMDQSLRLRIRSR